jgi:parallel beta-helix repeat protein
MKNQVRVIIMLCILLGALGIANAPVPRDTVLRVPRDYPTIQAAVYAANPGDTIRVANGTYYGNVDLGTDKDNILLLGDNAHGTIINGSGMDQPLYIKARNVLVSGFTMCLGARCGVYFDNTSGVSLIGNIIANNNNYGIDIESSSNCLVVQNTIANNLRYGMFLYYSNSNKIYHNNFFNNIQVVEAYSTDRWDNGYPSGGNYWSDYNGKDLYSDPFQNQTGSDGIGDSPYVIDADNQDNYPFMNPYGSPDMAAMGMHARSLMVKAIIPSNVNGDGKVNVLNPMLVAFYWDSAVPPTWQTPTLAVTAASICRTLWESHLAEEGKLDRQTTQRGNNYMLTYRAEFEAWR